MRSDEKEIEEKVKKKCSLNESKTSQDKETKAIESVEWIEPCLNWQPSVSPDEYWKIEKLAIEGKSRWVKNEAGSQG